MDLISSIGINTSRKIIQSETYLSQNKGDTLPEWNENKREMYSHILPRTTVKEMDSPVVLRQMSNASKSFKMAMESTFKYGLNRMRSDSA